MQIIKDKTEICCGLIIRLRRSDMETEDNDVTKEADLKSILKKTPTW